MIYLASHPADRSHTPLCPCSANERSLSLWLSCMLWPVFLYISCVFDLSFCPRLSAGIGLLSLLCLPCVRMCMEYVLFLSIWLEVFLPIYSVVRRFGAQVIKAMYRLALSERSHMGPLQLLQQLHATRTEQTQHAPPKHARLRDAWSRSLGK